MKTPQPEIIQILQELSFTKHQAENITYRSGSSRIGKILLTNYDYLKKRGYSNDDITRFASRENGGAKIHTVVNTHDILIKYFKQHTIVTLASCHDGQRILRLISKMYPTLQKCRPSSRKIVEIASKPKAHIKLKELFENKPADTTVSRNDRTYVQTPPPSMSDNFNWITYFEEYDELSYLQTDIDALTPEAPFPCLQQKLKPGTLNQKLR